MTSELTGTTGDTAGTARGTAFGRAHGTARGRARRTDSAAEPAECEGSACRLGAATGRARAFAVAGTPLCPDCRLRLAHDLRRLPRLYEECGLLLGGTDRPRDRTSGGGRTPGLPFNTAAADARSAIAGTLRSWAALVVQERGVGAPPGTVAGTAGFLLRHSGWLAAHRAAGELSHEVAKAVRRARHVIEPTPVRRVPVGGCVEPDCQGDLTAAVRPRGSVPVEISCDAVTSHRWSAHEWLKLGHRPAAGPREPSPAAGRAGAAVAISTTGTTDSIGTAGTTGTARAGAPNETGAPEAVDATGTPGARGTTDQAAAPQPTDAAEATPADTADTPGTPGTPGARGTTDQAAGPQPTDAAEATPADTAGTPEAPGTRGRRGATDQAATSQATDAAKATPADTADTPGTPGTPGTRGATDQADAPPSTATAEATGAADTAGAGPAACWLSARDIALLWGIAPGSVYRRASEHRWRRRTRNGRTYYHGEDVHESLDTGA